jgi:hypothetical protein
MKRAHDPILSRFDRLQCRAFDALANYAGNDLVFNGKKARVISQPISYELIQEIVGFKPKRFADIEIKWTDFARLGLDNEVYVALDDVVLRVLKDKSDPSDISRHLVLHSTPDQDAGASAEEEGSIPLAIGQQVVQLPFRIVDPQADYVFISLYVENTIDAPPLLDLDPTPGARTSSGRTLHLPGAPDTENYVLRYKIKT